MTAARGSSSGSRSYGNDVEEPNISIDQIFGSTGNVSWSQECARALLLFVYGAIVVRLAGRRLFAKWSALDIVVAIVTGSSLSRALTGNADLFGTLAAITLLIVLHWVLARACARHSEVSLALEGEPVLLGSDGAVYARSLIRYGVSQTDVQEAILAAGAETPEQTRKIVLLPNGKIAVLTR